MPGTFILKASYRDRGSPSQIALESGEVLALRPAFLQAEQADSLSSGIRTYRPFEGDTVVLRDMKSGSFVLFKHSDLTGVHSIAVGIGSGDKSTRAAGGVLEIRLDSPSGPLLGSAKVAASNPPKRMEFSVLDLPLTTRISDGRFHDLYLVVKNPGSGTEPVVALDWVRFDL